MRFFCLNIGCACSIRWKDCQDGLTGAHRTFHRGSPSIIGVSGSHLGTRVPHGGWLRGLATRLDEIRKNRQLSVIPGCLLMIDPLGLD